MTLPADIARCPGIQLPHGWRTGCEDCYRRTCPPTDHPRVAHMSAPEFLVGPCHYRIERPKQ